MPPDTPRFWQTTPFWALVATVLSGAATAWAFVIQGSPILKAAFATATALVGALEVYSVVTRRSRVTAAPSSHSSDSSHSPHSSHS